MIPAKSEDFEFGKKFWMLAEKLLNEGKFKVPPVELRKNGINGILGGLNELREGKISGTKLVYRIGDTA